MTVQLLAALRLEQIKHVGPRRISSHLCDDLILILPYQLLLKAAKHFKKLQVDGFLDSRQRNLLCDIVDRSYELRHVQSQELCVVLEDLIKEQSRSEVRIHVPHEDVNIVVDFQLTLEVVADVGDQESVTRLDQLLVLLARVRLTVDPELDNR